MTEHVVVIAGGGPTGQMLAGELALAGVDVAIVAWVGEGTNLGLSDALTTWFGPPSELT